MTLNDTTEDTERTEKKIKKVFLYETGCQASIIFTMRFGHGEGPVFYASLPMASSREQNPQGCGTHMEKEKLRLVSMLLDHFGTMENRHQKGRPYFNRIAWPVRVVNGFLGRPRLLVGELGGPAISFSEYGKEVWGALSGDAFDIGIDVAGGDEFCGQYPFDRVFHAHELAHALKWVGNDLEKASALLWSIKEAVAKALGCGFHLVDPKQIMVYPAEGAPEENGTHTFPVGLSGKAATRFPESAGKSLRVRSLFLEKMWLSIALLKWQYP